MTNLFFILAAKNETFKDGGQVYRTEGMTPRRIRLIPASHCGLRAKIKQFSRLNLHPSTHVAFSKGVIPKQMDMQMKNCLTSRFAVIN